MRDKSEDPIWQRIALDLLVVWIFIASRGAIALCGHSACKEYKNDQGERMRREWSHS
jgi:hypothetical protein